MRKTKKERITAILRIIKEYEIENQAQLCDALEKRGISAAQSMISRDINELELQKKRSTKTGLLYYVAKNDAEVDIFESLKHGYFLKNAVTKIDVSENLIVLKCRDGFAEATSSAIDGLELHGILGCVAGGNTIIIALKDKRSSETVYKKLSEFIFSI